MSETIPLTAVAWFLEESSGVFTMLDNPLKMDLKGLPLSLGGDHCKLFYRRESEWILHTESFGKKVLNDRSDPSLFFCLTFKKKQKKRCSLQCVTWCCSRICKCNGFNLFNVFLLSHLRSPTEIKGLK